MTSARAIAHPNIALAKYWGKQNGPGNYPAVPSLSVTLDGLATTTKVTLDDSLAKDIATINGQEVVGEPKERIVTLLGLVRAKLSATGETPAFCCVESTNDFPTSSGLASSASGFAALTIAADGAYGTQLPTDVLSDLARRISASSARSFYSDFVVLASGPEAPTGNELLAARPFAERASLPLEVLVAVTTEGAKEVKSTGGMNQTRDKSPVYDAWKNEAPRIFADVKAAIETKSFERLGEAAERSALLMHATMIAGGLVYWNAGTMEAMHTVRKLRAKGTAAYFTIDAGPHVKVLVEPENVRAVKAALESTPSVLRVLRATLGDGARLVS